MNQKEKGSEIEISQIKDQIVIKMTNLYMMINIIKMKEMI